MVMLDDIYSFLDGREYTLDGIHGTFRNTGVYPYEKVMHLKSPEGRESTEYLETKALLGDHWDSDLTENLERLSQIAFDLGWHPHTS